MVSGHDVAGADVALVRADLSQPFAEAFGGVIEPSRVVGWNEVTGCRVRPLDSLPDALEGVVQLLRTMNPPALRLVGGIQVPGGYLGFEGLLPKVRAHGAELVRVTSAETSVACDQVEDHEWELPSFLVAGPLPADVRVIGEWRLSDNTRRSSERTLKLWAAPVDDGFKPLAGGDYFVESCRPGQREVSSGDPVDLMISSVAESATYDLLEAEPSARFLGPGLGEMSLHPSPTFDWLAVGPKNAPEMLVFVGDPSSPQGVAARRSPDSGDRRHWKRAFGRPKRVLVRTHNGEYLPIDQFPELSSSWKDYSRHSPPDTVPSVPATRLDTISSAPPGRCAMSADTIRLADALAALSTQRGGLRYRTVLTLFEELVGLSDPPLNHELVRAWVESGAMDVVRHQSYGSTRVIARRPRFVAVRRGPFVEASLLGLVTSARRAQLERAASEARLELRSLEAGCPWQPSVLRIRASWEQLTQLSASCELASPEWLLWGADGELHARLQTRLHLQGLRDDPPPSGYSLALTWDWDHHTFVRGVDPQSSVRVEQRVHPRACSIFVVLVDDQVLAWTHIRNWALLCAFEAAGRAPFTMDHKGWVTTEGRSPVHLPVPIGRVCTVVGEGLPGPILDRSKAGVVGYCYPFGGRVTHLVSRELPRAWISQEES